MTCTRNDWRDRGRVALIVLALTLAAKLSVPGTAWAQAGDEPGWALDDLAVLYQPFPYEAKDVALTDMLQQMTIKTGVPVIAAQGLAGRVSVANGSGSLRDALDQVSGDAGLLWWFDAGRGYPANGYYGAGYPAGNFGAGNFGVGNFGAAPAPATSGATAPGYFAPATAPAAGRASQ